MASSSSTTRTGPGARFASGRPVFCCGHTVVSTVRTLEISTFRLRSAFRPKFDETGREVCRPVPEHEPRPTILNDSETQRRLWGWWRADISLQAARFVVDAR